MALFEGHCEAQIHCNIFEELGDLQDLQAFVKSLPLCPTTSSYIQYNNSVGYNSDLVSCPMNAEEEDSPRDPYVTCYFCFFSSGSGLKRCVSGCCNPGCVLPLASYSSSGVRGVRRSPFPQSTIDAASPTFISAEETVLRKSRSCTSTTHVTETVVSSEHRFLHPPYLWATFVGR